MVEMPDISECGKHATTISSGAPTMKTCLTTSVLCAATLAAARSLAADDILIADFEGPDYGAWKTTGEAFGTGPARGTLPKNESKGRLVSRRRGDWRGWLTKGPRRR